MSRQGASSLASSVKFTTTRAIGTAAASTCRFVARHRGRALRPDAFTVVAVNWNTAEFLVDLLRALDKFSPGVEAIIVDNASNDASRTILRQAKVRSVLLPINLGHGPGLDIAASLVRTEYFATLDIDAFPVRADWLDDLRRRLEEGNVVVGGTMHRGFAHPSMLAMRTRDFRDRHHSFMRSAWKSGKFEAGESWDVAERISMREPGRVGLVKPSEIRGPGVIGTVYGGIVYHNWFSAQGPAAQRAAAREAWTEAVARFIDTPA
jgi:glycosyltransferase involved in cell wall biosynthesis